MTMMNTGIAKREPAPPPQSPEDMSRAVERVLIVGDLSTLTSPQRVHYYNRVCESIGVNPLTKPFAYLQLNGKLTLYALRDCADQLRRLRGISIQLVERTVTKDGLLVVHVRATDKDGRSDEDFGVVPFSHLKGEAASNAILKAITKAKRRVTLSICGLGWLDETEVDTIPDAVKIEPPELGLEMVKRKSSAAAKRDGDFEATFKELMRKLENPEGAIDCKEAWDANAQWLSTAPARWYTLLLEAYDMSMKGFGVEIDLDEYDQQKLRDAA